MASRQLHCPNRHARYGDYQQEPEEPYPGSASYPPKIYGTWDPNTRGFVGTTLVMCMEEFPHILSKDTQKLIVESLHNATKGDEYRFGHLDKLKDNLYPSYSNPAIMRALTSGWTGRRLNDKNITNSAERDAKDIIDLFDLHGTLSEFNSATYTGVSLFGLVLWSKYLPKDSVMAQNAPRMVATTWDTVSQMWHPGMKNIAGPWDRSYGYDMNRYVALMGMWIWTLIGKDKSSLAANVSSTSNSPAREQRHSHPASAADIQVATDHVAHGRLRLGTALRRACQYARKPDLQGCRLQALQVQRRAHLYDQRIRPAL